MLENGAELDSAFGINFGFSEVHDGNMSFKWGDLSEVIANRQRFLNKNSCSLSDVISPKIINRDKVVRVDKSHRGKGATSPKDAIIADALITNQSGLVLFLFIGDCIPMLLFDPSSKSIGLAHLGWQSTDLELAEHVVLAMKQSFGCQPKDLLVTLGPGIKKDSYQKTNPQQKDKPEWQPYLKTATDGQTSIDIFTYNDDQLTKSGVLPSNITISPVDTATNDKYFSHYQDIRRDTKEGRFAAYIRLI